MTARERGDDLFERLRNQVLSVRPGALGLAPTRERPHVWAALMEWGIDDDVAMLITIADGTASLYLSRGDALAPSHLATGRHRRTFHTERTGRHRSAERAAPT